MNRCLLIYFICLLIIKSNAQSRLTGYVKDSLQTPVENVMVTIQDTANKQTLAFSITDANGFFDLHITHLTFPFLLQARALNYATYQKKLNAGASPLLIILQHQINEIKEVTVKTGPIIVKRGDTISYRVDAFAQLNDRSIADVLSRMPGIEVNQDGKIFYLGKPIDKYYIDGMDLLEGKYNLANKNLPYNSVTSVQVLENHQPIKLLDSLVPSEKTSLNIKLKNNITTTGTVYALTGFSPFLYEGNITPMLFKKKMQMIASYQFNNSGNNTAKQLATLSIEELTNNLTDKDEPNTPLNIVALQTPNINSNKYLFNRIQMPTLQYLKKLNNGLEVKLAVSYIKDKQLQTGNNTTIYSINNGNLELNEQIANSYTIHHLENSIVLQNNSSKVFYKNITKLNGYWNQQVGIIQQSNHSLYQRTKNNFLAISNNLKAIVPIGKQLVTFHSIINYHQKPDMLTVTPGVYSYLLNNNVAYQKTEQTFTQYYFRTQQAAEIIKLLGKYTFTGRAGINTIQQQTNGTILLDDSVFAPLPFKNKLNILSTNAYITQEWNKKLKRGDMGIKIPIQYTQINLKENLQLIEDRKQLVTINPVLYFRYDLSGTWQWNTNFSYQQKIDNYLNITYGYVLKNYRNLQVSPYPLAVVKSFNFSTVLFYRSTLHASFFNLFYIYTQSQQPYLLNSTIQPNGSQQITAIARKNTTQLHMLETRFSKMIANWHSNFSISANLSLQQYNQFINQNFTQSSNVNIKSVFTWSSNFSALGEINYNFTPQWFILNMKNNKPNTSFLYSQSLNYAVPVSKTESISLNQELYFNAATATNQQTLFTDVLYRKQFSKSKTDIELGVRNLFNNNYIVNNSINPYYTLQSGFYLRPRQFTIAVRFAFH